MPRNKYPWPLLVSYAFWKEAIVYYWGHHRWWQYKKYHQFADQFREDMADAIGCYCMGGEL